MALIHLFRDCNQRCVFCSYPQAPEPRPTLKEWLKEIAAMPPGLVQISGGEPLLAGADALCLLIGAARRLGRPVELQTNALAAASLPERDLARLARALKAAGGYFNVNFPAATAAADYRITRAPGGFAARKAGVARLLASGAPVRLTCVVSSLNFRSLPAWAALVRREFAGAAWVQFSYIKGIGRAAGGGLAPAYRAAAPYLLKALASLEEAGLPCEVDHIPPCRLGRFAGLNVDMEKMRAGRPGPHLEEKAHVAACRGCRYLELCPGPRKDYMETHRNI